MRPDVARHRADSRGVRGAAPGDVPPAHRVPPEQDRGDRIPPRGRWLGVVATPTGAAARARSFYLPPWRIDLLSRPGVDVPASFASIARLAARSLAAAKAPAPASLALIFSDDGELAELNAAHMGVTGPTDVLSFPMLSAAAFPRHEGKQPDATSGMVEPDYQPPAGQRHHLGDIVISVERAIEQAREGRGGPTSDLAWSAPDEVRLLVVHGVLHVCGWDHAHPGESQAMRALERRILARA